MRPADGRDPIPVILMTAICLISPSAVGADAVHIKPFHVDQLLALLDRFLALDGPAS
jgi:hypothetical protein